MSIRDVIGSCYRCNGTDNVVLCRVEMVPDSAGVIRPVCANCRNPEPPPDDGERKAA